MEFSFLFLVIKIKKFILRFFLFINHSVYSPSYFHLHISLLRCCGVFLFVFLVKEKISFKDFFLYITLFILSTYFYLQKINVGCVVWSFPLCVCKKKKRKKNIHFKIFFSIFSSFTFFSFFLMNLILFFIYSTAFPIVLYQL